MREMLSCALYRQTHTQDVEDQAMSTNLQNDKVAETVAVTITSSYILCFFQCLYCRSAGNLRVSLFASFVFITMEGRGRRVPAPAIKLLKTVFCFKWGI